LAKLKKVCGRSHFTPVHRDNGASGYCLKEDTRVDGPWEYGVKPVRRNNKDDWDAVRKSAEEGKMDEIPAEILIRHY